MGKKTDVFWNDRGRECVIAARMVTGLQQSIGIIHRWVLLVGFLVAQGRVEHIEVCFIRRCTDAVVVTVSVVLDI